ncbi:MULTISPECIES: alpha/beta fold hydrolase [unclassified Microbacterium]|uniref:alpha/beta fold hydrolase n=1 Tax=unclassified Microbacterium TaxID=2609290 RepID=UPI000EAA1654|nr:MULTISPECIES: alpha/beta hydrolase [unclassified Microbacterium]MBT2484329.1 alpha/beta hydrolase [Microbacterium sp. ISL-108]RKN67246.1 alpha/beta hydrolase [Microbacterium sp. CGR2]
MIARRLSVDVEGATVSVAEWAAPQPFRRTVLLLHGGGVDTAELSWGALGPALASAGYRVLAPDHPGFGRTPRATWSLTQQRLIQYVGEVVDGLELTDYIVGGLSLGGGLTLGHTLERPDGPRGLMLLGSFGIMPRLVDSPLSSLTHYSTYLLLRSGLLAAMTRSYARNPAAMEHGLRSLVRDPSSRTRELVQAVIDEASSGTALETFGEWQRDQVQPRGLRTDYTDRLGDIDVPALVVHGDRDGGVGIARARTAAELLPQGTLVEVPGAGHWVQRDRPDVVTAAIVDFLENGV